MSTTSSPTFCPAPWTTLNIDQTGRVMPCMHSGFELGNIKNTTIQDILHGKEINDLKSAMAAGQWHQACKWCQRLEETAGNSGRTCRKVSDQVKEKIDQDIHWFGLEHITVNWSNLCNLTCMYCNPETSTAWQSVRHIPINHVKNEHSDLIQLARDHGHTIRGLTLGGGEPLLQKGLLDFLKCLVPEQVNVLITTNLSVDIATNPIYQELRTWPHVSWMISFDNANADKFEYVRDRAKWAIFLQNIDILKTDCQHVWAHPAYSIYCAFDLEEYYDFCVEKNLDIFWCELTDPWALDVRRMPEHARNLAIAEIDRIAEKYQTFGNLAVGTLLQYKKTLENNSYLFEPEYRPNTLTWHHEKERELGKSTTFEQLWPNVVRILNQ